MSKPLIMLTLLMLLAVSLSAQQRQKPLPEGSSFYTIPLTSTQKENPIKSTPESLARGKRQYTYDCAMCHGSEGNGRGPVAKEMKLNMHDQSDPATFKDLTDGSLFYIIKNGKNRMPPEGQRVTPEQLWDLVNYVRSFAKQALAADKTPN